MKRRVDASQGRLKYPSDPHRCLKKVSSTLHIKGVVIVALMSSAEWA